MNERINMIINKKLQLHAEGEFAKAMETHCNNLDLIREAKKKISEGLIALRKLQPATERQKRASRRNGKLGGRPITKKNK
jgi:hypothetical protein